MADFLLLELSGFALVLQPVQHSTVQLHTSNQRWGLQHSRPREGNQHGYLGSQRGGSFGRRKEEYSTQYTERGGAPLARQGTKRSARQQTMRFTRPTKEERCLTRRMAEKTAFSAVNTSLSQNCCHEPSDDGRCGDDDDGHL